MNNDQILPSKVFDLISPIKLVEINLWSLTVDCTNNVHFEITLNFLLS
jgi:hypothetical protein